MAFLTIVIVDPSRILHTTLLGKIIRLPFRILPRGVVVRVVRGPACGMRWIAHSSTHGFWLGYWELENQRRFASRLRAGDVVYDIGAHVGLYTLLSSRKVGSTGHVYAFEPFPRNADYLRRHVELNHLTNCTVTEAAVAKSSCFLKFDPTELDSAGHLSSSGKLSVRATSIDEFASSARSPTAIKINAEGAEIDVLAGARETIRKFKPLIFLSTHSEELHRGCWELLLSFGYYPDRISSDKVWAEPQSV
ncbi:MAG: FkbM family methyltransferase [Candidatus Acidiferrales bacterium]